MTSLCRGQGALDGLFYDDDLGHDRFFFCRRYYVEFIAGFIVGKTGLCVLAMARLVWCAPDVRGASASAIAVVSSSPADTGMNTGTRITGGEVTAEAGIDMIVTSTGEGKKIIVTEAGAAVEVLIMTNAVGEADMMTIGVVGAVLMKVSPLLVVPAVLRGAPLLAGHIHLGVGVLMDAITKNAHLLQKVFLCVVDLLFLEALPDIPMLMV